MTAPQGSVHMAAFVPMRHESERVPGKNYRELDGRPLYSYILETLLKVDDLQLIVVDTDSEMIRDGIRRNYPAIRLVDRPEHLRSGDTPMNDVLMFDAQQIEASFYLQTHSTNPLLKAETIRTAVASFFDAYPEHDSLFGVTRLQTRLWSETADPINHDPAVLLRTQDLPPVYEENSCIYIFAREPFLESGLRIGSRPLMFEIEAGEALDIDDELDFEIADFLIRRGRT
jgi:CMP-N-acetylneuraminic acid synthetase